MSSVAAIDRPALLSHHPVGASTGYMSDLRGDWKALVGRAQQISPFSVELSALTGWELGGLIEYLDSDPPLPFRYLSIHGPSKEWTASEAEMVESLVHLSTRAHAVVMHPDTIENVSLYLPLGRKLVLENMDDRKHDGRTVEEMASWFEKLPLAGFCFDIAHAWSLDKVGTVAARLLDAFGGRLRHVHLSSLSSELHHVPLTEQDENLFMPLLRRCIDVPWILEAPIRN